MPVATIFLCGDVMTGRGVDQTLAHAGDPRLHEPGVDDARRYLALAEATHGAVEPPLAPDALWGDAVGEWARVRPLARIGNLETAVTTSADWCRGKEVHYRMHPANVDCLAAAAVPGIDLLPDLADGTAEAIGERIASVKRSGDIVVASIHWGSNWGHTVPGRHVRFARRLVAHGVDVVHGHSSHHVRPIEVHRGRLILHGCGDFVDDYEGIRGYDAFRPDLGLMYFATLEADGRLATLRMVPVRMERLRLRRVRGDDVRWLATTLTRTSGRFGCRVAATETGELCIEGQVACGGPAAEAGHA